ncbi:MBL fold metallo-hydrolase [Nocardiopsis terrae]|uniref:Glyoxylase-like metal-dependent hydrolase (Beta-lactamase superfamily II) n=1 Tax=Nocardiopsis terrae TaxID=372655 RepID=A0ABR9HKY6_9ACTN|nr:MBL fold metallo-hydrolase [Nocardiopsis terrae]MBE1459699.1 glyoxylase-like metal-dependent hydrolase (beta-lactamase superfamily II) [Nocardiopsis terrae]GHC94449.1 MBL fold metallo-hydrolase [Nocardiopsis terrae]
MRDVPPVEDLGEGLWSIPVPVPGNPIGFTYVYAISAPGGPVLVDTGWHHDDSWEALVSGLKQTGHSIDQVQGAVLTHFHADHAGLTGRLREASDAWVAMHPSDAEVLRRLGERTDDERSASVIEQMVRAGFPEEDVETFRSSPAVFPSPALPDLALGDGERADVPGLDLRAVWTPGHTPGHLCLHLAERDLLFTGDHVLPRITPHVGQFPLDSADGDPLGDFLAAQARIGRMPGADRLLCLPSHERRFTGLPARTGEIVDHHEERLESMARLLTRGATTLWELTSSLEWRRPWTEMRIMARHMAASETAAHLRLLEERGLVRRTGPAELPRWASVTRAHGPE